MADLSVAIEKWEMDMQDWERMSKNVMSDSMKLSAVKLLDLSNNGLGGALHEKRAQVLLVVRGVAQGKDGRAHLDAPVDARTPRWRADVHPAGPSCL